MGYNDHEHDAFTIETQGDAYNVQRHGHTFIITKLPNPGAATLFILIGIALAMLLPVVVWKAIFDSPNAGEVPYVALICFGIPIVLSVRFGYKVLKSRKGLETPADIFYYAYIGGALLFFIVALFISRTGIIPSMYTGWGSLFWDIVGIGFISFLAGLLPGAIAAAAYAPIYLFCCKKIR